jgi:hypothetical protein
MLTRSRAFLVAALAVLSILAATRAQAQTLRTLASLGPTQ